MVKKTGKKTLKKARRKPIAERRLERRVEFLEEDKLLLTNVNLALMKDRQEADVRASDVTAKFNFVLTELGEAKSRNDGLHLRNKKLSEVNEDQRTMNAALREDSIRLIRKNGDVVATLSKARMTGAIFTALYLASRDGLDPVEKLQRFTVTAEKNGTPLESLDDEALRIHQEGSTLFSKLTIDALKDIKEKECPHKRSGHREVPLSFIEEILDEVLSARR